MAGIVAHPAMMAVYAVLVLSLILCGSFFTRLIAVMLGASVEFCKNHLIFCGTSSVVLVLACIYNARVVSWWEGTGLVAFLSQQTDQLAAITLSLAVMFFGITIKFAAEAVQHMRRGSSVQ